MPAPILDVAGLACPGVEQRPEPSDDVVEARRGHPDLLENAVADLELELVANAMLPEESEKALLLSVDAREGRRAARHVLARLEGPRTRRSRFAARSRGGLLGGVERRRGEGGRFRQSAASSSQRLALTACAGRFVV